MVGNRRTKINSGSVSHLLVGVKIKLDKKKKKQKKITPQLRKNKSRPNNSLCQKHCNWYAKMMKYAWNRLLKGTQMMWHNMVALDGEVQTQRCLLYNLSWWYLAAMWQGLTGGEGRGRRLFQWPRQTVCYSALLELCGAQTYTHPSPYAGLPPSGPPGCHRDLQSTLRHRPWSPAGSAARP